MSEFNSNIDQNNVIGKPKNYKVLLLNGKFDSLEFVVNILMRIFHKSNHSAMEIANVIYHSGVGVAGIYSKDVAETKAYEVIYEAQCNGHPLKCQIEEVS